MTSKSTYTIVDVGPEVKGTCKQFKGVYGFVNVPSLDAEAFLHKKVLPVDESGRPIEPQDGSPVLVKVGRTLKDGKDLGFGVAEIKVLERRVKTTKKA